MKPLLNDPATLAEIATVMGKSKRSIERWSIKEAWKHSLADSHSRHKKHLYALKDLPKKIREALFDFRLTQETHHAQRNNAGESGPTYPERRGNDGRADRRATGAGDALNDVPDRPVNEGGDQSLLATAVVGPSSKGGLGTTADAVVLLRPLDTPGAGVAGVPAMQGAGTDGGNNPQRKSLKGRRVDVNAHGSAAGAVAPAYGGGLPSVVDPRRPDALAIDDAQRLTDGARQQLLQFAERYPGSMAAACSYLSSGYANGTLSDALKQAIEQCNDRVNAERQGKVSVSTLAKWKQLKKTTGHCVPAKTRQKTDWKSVWWMPLFLACYRKPQKPHITEAYQEFEQDWLRQGFDTADMPSYGSVNTLLMRVPRITRETGRRTGAELAALKSFIRRDWGSTSNEVWVGDGHTFKAKVRHPETGRAFASEVTVIVDAASTYMVGWAFSLSENQIAVSEALGQGMLKNGQPIIYY